MPKHTFRFLPHSGRSFMWPGTGLPDSGTVQLMSPVKIANTDMKIVNEATRDIPKTDDCYSGG